MRAYTIGGYSEVGRNMTAVEIGDEIVIFDMGYNMEKVVEFDGEMTALTSEEAIHRDAIPDDSLLRKKAPKVKAIVVSHGHLDHVGAVAKMAREYKAPIYCTAYTSLVLKKIAAEEARSKAPLRNKLMVMNAGETAELTNALSLEFVQITHSIPESVVPVIHSPEGAVVYGCDLKLDDTPTLGAPPDYRRLKQLGKQGVALYVADMTRIESEMRCRSEKVVQLELENTINRCYEEKGAVFVTTFSSHIARLLNIVRANKDRREIVFFGRSLRDYLGVAEKRGIIDKIPGPVFTRRTDLQRVLDGVKKKRSDYLVICTGNQGEPNAVLPRIAQEQFPFRFTSDDHVIFSSQVIPTPINESNRYQLEQRLKHYGTRLYKDVHCSGHAMKEDQRDMIRMLKPLHLLPAHGDLAKLSKGAELADEEGYTLGKDVHLSRNGNILDLSV